MIRTGRTLAVLAAAVLSVASSAFAQAQVPAQPPQGTATIRGHITAADTGKPLVRVRVSLTQVTDGPSQGYQRPAATSTSASGRFELKDVPAGTYRLSAARPGYVTIQWGQHRARENGQTLEVKSGQTVDRIDVALPKTSVVAGRVTDELGQPYPGVQVEALELRYLNRSRHRVPFPGGVRTTDDRGQFRIDGLQPGSYQVLATSSERWIGAGKQPLGYVSTAFPGVPADQAQPVTLGLGQQRIDLDISLIPSRPIRVAGRVQNASGEPLAGESVSLARELPGSGAVSVQGAISARTNRDGTFEIRDAMPGSYRLSTNRRGSNGLSESASLHLAIAGADVEGLVLVPRSASSVEGAVVTDDGAAPPSLINVRVLLVPGDEDKVMGTVRVQPVKPDGSFQLMSVGGPFLFRLTGLPDAWMIKSVRLNDDDITEVPYDVPTGGRTIGGLQIVITQKFGKASGDVLNDKGAATADATVVLFPDEAALWVPGSRFVRTIRPTSGGHFSISQLPAGKYRAAARDFVEDGQENDPEFLESLRRDASTFELIEGGSATLTLKLPKP